MNQLYVYIYPLFFWISFPFRSPQSTEFPKLYSRFSLVIYVIHSINSAYMSIPISQFIPHSLPPRYPYICSLCLCVRHLLESHRCVPCDCKGSFVNLGISREPGALRDSPGGLFAGGEREVPRKAAIHSGPHNRKPG